jgi:two-component system chemotaxis response regulator CheB
LSAVYDCEALIASEDAEVLPGRILIAPGDAHLALRRQSDHLRVKLDRKPVASGCTPSVDTMFASLAAVFGGDAMGIVLSGMGRDGAEGARQIVTEGGAIFAQDEASCAVWGMPRAVAEAGLASAILPPGEIASRIAAAMRATGARRAAWK